MSVVACVVVTEPGVFDWLGHRPVLLWSLSCLAESRGVDSVVCLCAKPLVARLRAATERLHDRPEVREIPGGVGHKAVRAHFGSTLAADDVAAFVRPCFPFLKEATVERCVTLVASGKVAAAFPSAPAEVLNGVGLVTVPAAVGGLFVVRVGRSATWTGSYEAVPAAAVEAVDASDRFGRRVAEAVVETAGV